MVNFKRSRLPFIASSVRNSTTLSILTLRWSCMRFYPLCTQLVCCQSAESPVISRCLPHSTWTSPALRRSYISSLRTWARSQEQSIIFTRSKQLSPVKISSSHLATKENPTIVVLPFSNNQQSLSSSYLSTVWFNSVQHGWRAPSTAISSIHVPNRP